MIDVYFTLPEVMKTFSDVVIRKDRQTDKQTDEHKISIEDKKNI